MEYSELFNVAARTVGVGAALVVGGKVLLNAIYNKASGLTRMRSNYKKAMEELYASDMVNGLPVAGEKTLKDIQEGKANLKDLISKETMENGNVENIVILSPQRVMIKTLEEELRYDLDTDGRFGHLFWTRQFLDDPKKMIEETKTILSTPIIRQDKNLGKDIKKALRGRSSEPNGLWGGVLKVFNQETLYDQMRGIENALNYGMAVMLSSDKTEQRFAVDDGYMFFKTNGTAYAIATSQLEEQAKLGGCEAEANFWDAEEVLKMLIEVNREQGEIFKNKGIVKQEVTQP